MFHFYLLGGDTAAPSGLYAKLYHAFLILYIYDSTIDMLVTSGSFVRSFIHYSFIRHGMSERRPHTA